ncbi:MAG: metallophosphoesterase [Candidatus Thermoplasmatota archaeon]
MRIYASADIHGAQHRINIILKNVQIYRPDIVIICGDITQFGPSDLAINLLNQIPVKTLAIHGNIDPRDVTQAISNSKAVNIHLRQIVINGKKFLGIGGDITGELSEYRIENDRSILLSDAIDTNTIVISHIPPYGTQDKVFIGRHIGSRELLKIVQVNKPMLVLCGHVHEDPGVTRVDQTIIVNCSMGKRTEGAIVDINDSINVKIID